MSTSLPLVPVLSPDEKVRFKEIFWKDADKYANGQIIYSDLPHCPIGITHSISMPSLMVAEKNSPPICECNNARSEMGISVEICKNLGKCPVREILFKDSVS